jgi:hypothetical protein
MNISQMGLVGLKMEEVTTEVLYMQFRKSDFDQTQKYLYFLLII